MIQFGNPVLATEIIAHSEICFLQGRTEIQSQILVPFVFETGRGQDGIEHPFRLEFPTNTATRNNRILSFHVNADANYELQIWIINIGTANFERHVENIRSRPERFAVNAGGSFQSNEN